MGEQRVWVLRTRYTELSQNLRAEWDIYIRFYTVFLTFNMAALAWAFASERHSQPVRMVAWAFVVQTILTAGASAFLALHSRDTWKRQEHIETLLLELEQTSIPTAPPPLS